MKGGAREGAGRKKGSGQAAHYRAMLEPHAEGLIQQVVDLAKDGDMAARNRKGLSENTRARIQTTMIVKRLEDHILGKVEMTSSQVSAASILIKKTLPDLQSVQVEKQTPNNSIENKTVEELNTELEEIRDLAETLKSAKQDTQRNTH